MNLGQIALALEDNLEACYNTDDQVELDSGRGLRIKSGIQVS